MRAYAVKMMEKHENGRQRRKRTGILLQALQVFLRFRYEKPTFPLRKTYGSHGGNIRFAKGKHKNNGNVTRFSTRGFLKNRIPEKKTALRVRA